MNKTTTESCSVEQGFYEKISAWLVLAIISIGSAWLALVRKMNANRFEVLEKSCGDIMGKLDSHDEKLADHDLHLANNTIRLESMQSDLTEIKTSVETINTSISERNEVLNGKLDRLLER